MKWYHCSSVDELKSIGSFRFVKECVKKDLKNKIQLKAKSWDALNEKVQILSDLFHNSISNNRHYEGFASEADKYIFCLLNLDGSNRLKNLGVKKIHYRNKDLATKWRNKIAKVIHPDHCNDSKAEYAMETLQQIYEEMNR